MQSLHELRFRSSPLVELRELASLAAAEREPFRELESDPGHCGLFVSKQSGGMTWKLAERQTVELFRSLATPARIDGLDADGGERAGDVVDLVLDGILQVESGDDFVCGADALSILGAEVVEAGGVLSREALLHAQELETTDAQTLAMSLYRYNHIPITPFWRAGFAGAQAILAHVGADCGALRRMLGRDWTLSENDHAWLSWMPVVAPFRQAPGRPTYKLYVSPRPERIRGVFEVVVRVLAAAPVPFKMGSSAAGLLRPDKLVAYFETREQLDEAASMLRRELAGCDAHGVPFTAALDDRGLLSWGVDPPDTEQVLRRLQRNSWRLWIVQRLGSALALARAARTASAVEPWRFAVARLQRLGVDVEAWTPSPALWGML